MILLTTTHPSRYGMLSAMLSHIMTLISRHEFIIQHYGDVDDTPLRHIADITGNYIQFNRQPDDRSVCHTKRAFEMRTDQRRWLNLDDDIYATLNALHWHHHTSRDECLSTGVVDITNGRGYEHWTLEKFNVAEFPYDQSLIGYFNMTQCLPVKGRLLTQLYSVPLDSMTDELWGPIELAYAEKGVRGYDIALFNAYKVNTKLQLIHRTGIESYHLGVDTPFLNKDWKSHVTL